ncbi:MAG TPA: hypothetical protein VH700_16850 [Gemmatimonadales bacterium]|jgi:hypothetical protein
MTRKLRGAATGGLVVAVAWTAALPAGAQGPPAKPVDVCALLTQEEAAAILGSAVEAPQKPSGSTCSYATQSGMGDDILIHMLPLTFASEEEFHAFVVEDTEKMNARIKKDLGDAVKPTTVDPVPEVGQPAYYVDPTLVVLKGGRVLSIVAADRKQATAVAAKAVPRF